MLKFSKEEIAITSLIILVVGMVSFFNFQDALLRARDETRRGDIGELSEALNKFHADFGYFPPSEDGKIVYCINDNFETILQELNNDPMFDKHKLFEGLRPCEWGEDQFDDLFDDEYPPYLTQLPQDPGTNMGYSYYYLSNLNRYQLYAHLEEGEDGVGFFPAIVHRQLNCGVGVCSFGKSYQETPLDISLEEYEKILEKERLEKTK